MCGIAIMINRKNEEVTEQAITAMTDMVAHRGPDGKGVYVKNNVALGHRRLAIIDLSDSGRQPMEYKNKVIVFNGEIYNYIELREELINAGYQFTSQSDTEVIVAAYDFWGENCVEHLRGMWAFALYDEKRNCIFFSRDRFGIKPLYYTQTENYFLAASEIKQFTTVNEFQSEIFEPAVYEFLQHGILNHNQYTFFKNVCCVLPGHNLIYKLSDNSFEYKQWYSLEQKISKKNHDIKNAASRFRKEFEEAVKIHLRSDVKLGSCLSGGMDSSSIVCMSRKILGKEMPVYTVTACNKDSRYDEMEYADAVISHCNTHSLQTFPDLNKLYSEDLLEKITWHQDQPVLSGSHFSEYAVFETAGKNKLIVMLDGQGSDEYLAGYHEFFLYRCLGLLRRLRLATLHITITQRASGRGYSVKSLYKTILKLWLTKNKQAPHHSWLQQKWASDMQSSPGATYQGFSKVNNLKDLSLAEIKETSIPYQLHSEDRNSMAFSVESRVPFLDHKLVEAMTGLDEDAYYQFALDKAPLREGMKDLLPEKIYNRKTKLGFVSSDDLWMKEHATEVKQRLATAVRELSKFVNEELLVAFDDYADGKQAYNNAFFRVLALYAFVKSTKIRL